MQQNWNTIMRFLIVAVAMVFLDAPASAAFVIMFPQNNSVNAGTTGNFFDVNLVNDSSVPIGPFALDSYNVQLSIPSATGITFTSVINSTTLSYLFAANSLGIVATPSANQIDWNDLAAIPPVVVPPGGSFGLGRVYYDVALNAPIGAVPVTVNSITTFADFPTFSAVPYTAGSGTLVVTTPAPPALWAAAAGFITLLLRGFRHDRASPAAIPP